MSNTVKVNTQLKNHEAVAKMAVAMGGRVLGLGMHRLYAGMEKGFGIQLNNWKFPIVIHEDGSLAFDDYNGHWGNRADIEKLTENYSTECIKLECDKLGWYCEQQANGELMVFHPSGGTILVQRNGTLDANGFVGGACAEATKPLAAALGNTVSESHKPEFTQTHLTQGETE